MRRSICISEPHLARAGEIGTWKFQYTTALPLPKGATLKFDLQSPGRYIDWEPPEVDLNLEENIIYLQLEKGEIIAAEEVETPESIVPQYEFTLPSPLKVGEKITIVMGAHPKSRKKEVGNRAQLTLQRRRPFLLYIDPKGKGNYGDPEIFTMDIRGNILTTIQILTPSFVAKNKRFDVTVRFEDEYGNLTNFAAEDTLIDLSYEHLRENLNWKLFVPETGFVMLPNLYFNEPGIYKIKLRNLKSRQTFISAPIKCFNENDRNLFWGLLHGESERVDSIENIENCLRYFRDDQTLNFYAVSPFEGVEETSNEDWKLITQNISEFNEEERFVALLGCQYVGEPSKEGARHIIFSKDGKALFRQKESKYSSLAKIYKSSSPKEMISIPTFILGKGSSFDFKEFNPAFERVVEIYNAWGSSEMTKKEGNSRPISGKIGEAVEGSLRQALNQNCRFGFVAGGLDDRGIYSEFYDSDQMQYSPGLTGVICEKFTREAIFNALYNRHCYGSTGERIIVGFYIAGHPMGSELSTEKKPGLAVNRHISGYVATTADIKTIEIVRNGEVLHTFTPQGYYFDYHHDDMDKLSQITIKGKGEHPFAYYYLRVTQADEHMAWSSPIWVDFIEKA